MLSNYKRKKLCCSDKIHLAIRSKEVEIYSKFAKQLIQIAGPKNIKHNEVEIAKEMNRNDM